MPEKEIMHAMMHKDILGAGAKKRKKLRPHDKIVAVMREFERGTLHSSDGKKVKSRAQALAIAFSEARKHMES